MGKIGRDLEKIGKFFVRKIHDITDHHDKDNWRGDHERGFEEGV